MAKKLTEQQVSDIIESTMAELESQGITDKETVRKIVSQQIENAKKEEKQNLRFMVEDLVKEMNVTEDTSAREDKPEVLKIPNDVQTQPVAPNSIDIDNEVIAPNTKKQTKQTAADVAKKYLDEKKEDHDYHNRSDKQDVKDFWTVRRDRKKKLNSVDENKSLKSWQKKLLKIMNKPVTLMDRFVKLCGKSFEPIFCIVIPMLVMFFPINYVVAGLINNIAEFVTYAAIPMLLFLLMFLPKIASAVEFPILGLFVLGRTGILRFLSPSFADWLDPYGRLTYLPGHSPASPTVVSNYQLALAWGTILAAIIFLFFKLFFFLYLKLKQYRRRYMVRHRHRKKYVAQLDKDSEVLM